LQIQYEIVDGVAIFLEEEGVAVGDGQLRLFL
jgi:hypothetical protein